MTTAHLATKPESITTEMMEAYLANQATINPLVTRPEAYRECQPEWVNHDGVSGLQVPGSRFFAVPVSGRKNSAKFDILEKTKKGWELGPQLTKKEVNSWLYRTALSEWNDAH